MAQKRNTLIPMVLLKRIKKTTQQKKQTNPNHSFILQFEFVSTKRCYYTETNALFIYTKSLIIISIQHRRYISMLYTLSVVMRRIKDINIFILRLNFPTGIFRNDNVYMERLKRKILILDLILY